MTNDENITVSVVIPFRADPQLPHLLLRLEDLCAQSRADGEVERIVVDSSQDLDHQRACLDICQRYSIRYVEDRQQTDLYCIAQARNTGAESARGSVIAFQDVDIRTGSDFWPRLLKFIQEFGVGRFKKLYFPVPCLYLTSEGSDAFTSTPQRTSVEDLLCGWLMGDPRFVELLTPCSSFMVVDRLHYLSIGGHNIEFVGHGFEDFDLHHRLVAELGVLPRPANYYWDSQNWQSPHFEGFRAQFSLLGRCVLSRGLLTVHIWHPRPPESKFYRKKELNGHALAEAMRRFDESLVHPAPLIASESRDKSFLFLGSDNSNSCRTLRDVFPLLGKPIITSEYHFFDEEAGRLDTSKLRRALEDGRVDRILFPNPYRNSARLSILSWCRENEFPFVVFERGALPDSWYFDNSGFTADSRSYSRENWDHELTSAQIEGVSSYVDLCLSGRNTLEAQGDLVGASILSSELATRNNKVLFVPLQRPSDTVTVHLAGPAKSFRDYLVFIDACAERLSDFGWIVLCKRHPWENHSPPLRFARYVDPNTNFLDLLAMCDAVALMNSGVGVYAMMASKPCYVFSEAFYTFPGLNEKMESLDLDGFIDRISCGLTVDRQRMFRFIHFLRNRFYSFGRGRFASWLDEDGSTRKVTTSIDFYEIRLPQLGTRIYSEPSVAKIPTSAPLFEQFRLSLDMNGC